MPSPDAPPERLGDGGPRYLETPADPYAIDAPFVAEPFNAVTASFFILICAVWAWRLRGRYRRFPFLVCCLPILLAGGRGLGLKHGQHIDYTRPHLTQDYTLTYEEWQSLCGKPKDDQARLSNVQLTMLQKMGVEAAQFVDSVGAVSEIVA